MVEFKQVGQLIEQDGARLGHNNLLYPHLRSRSITAQVSTSAHHDKTNDGVNIRLLIEFETGVPGHLQRPADALCDVSHHLLHVVLQI